MCRTCWVEGHFGANGPCLDMHLEACVMLVLVCMLELTEYVAACKNAGQVCQLALVTDMCLDGLLASPLFAEDPVFCCCCCGFMSLSSGFFPFLVIFVLFTASSCCRARPRKGAAERGLLSRHHHPWLWGEHDTPQACMLLYTSCSVSQ